MPSPLTAPSDELRAPRREQRWRGVLPLFRRADVAEAEEVVDEAPAASPETPSRLRRYLPFALVVLLPTLLTALYLFFIAADQYESEAHFFVLGASAPAISTGEQLRASAPPAPGEEKTLAVIDFMRSHDAVRGLQGKIGLVDIYRRPEADVLARMPADPTAEQMRKYLFRYARMINAYLDYSAGVGVLRVRAFRSEDAVAVAEALLQLGDAMVERLSRRLEEDALRVARAEVDHAEQRIVAVQEKITAFRLKEQAVDLGRSAGTILEVIGKLEGELAQARAELTAARTYLKPDNPRFIELATRVSALQAQIDAQRGRLTGPDGALAPTLATFERLELERHFAQQEYNSALGSLAIARLEAERQHLFLIRTVEPNRAEESEYPQSLLIVLGVFVVLTVAYGIGWLIFAGMREHAG